MTNGEWAKVYLAAGWSVFPANAKAPLIKTLPYRERLPTVEEVESWWKQWPNAQIGVQCGKISGITVIDIDRLVYDPSEKKKVPGKDDPESLMFEMWKNGCLTMTAKSGNGGRHLFCRYEPGISNSTKSIHPQIDVKNDGGNITLAPSVHNETGIAYEWHEFAPWSEFNLKNLASFPKHLFSSVPRETNKVDWKRIAEGITSGSRNSDITKLAGLLTTMCVGREHLVWAILMAFNTCYVSPPMQEKEVWTIFQSIVKTHNRNH